MAKRHADTAVNSLADVGALEHLGGKARTLGQRDHELLAIVRDRAGAHEERALGRRLVHQVVHDALPGALQLRGVGHGRTGGRGWTCRAGGVSPRSSALALRLARCATRAGRNPSRPTGNGSRDGGARLGHRLRSCGRLDGRRRSRCARSGRGGALVDLGGWRELGGGRHGQAALLQGLQLVLEVGHAVGEGVEGEVGLGAGDAGEGDFQDQALVGCGSHLAGGVAQDGEDAGEPVYGAEGGGLGA